MLNPVFSIFLMTMALVSFFTIFVMTRKIGAGTATARHYTAATIATVYISILCLYAASLASTHSS